MKPVGLNNLQVRKHNKALFMSLMWRHKQLSKSQLAHLSGLTIPATSKILQALLDEGKLQHSEALMSARGKSNGSFQLPSNGAWTLCLCVKPSSIERQLADAQLVAQGEFEQVAIKAETPETLLSEIEAVWRKTCKQWPKRRINLALAVHGQVDPVTGVSQHMPQAAWKTPLQLKFLLEEKLGVEVRVDNDCVMLALAEKWLNRNALSEFCVINVDYGIGSSFVINGEIFRGNLYGSGQIGHTIIEPNGQRCSCGRQGCLETVASLSTLKQAAHQRDPEAPQPSSTQLLQAWQAGEPWIVFEVLFLAIALPSHSVALLALTYGLRGVAYPMFAYAFLVWIQAAAPADMRGSATGWFWLAFTGGLPTLGSLVAIFSIQLIGEYATFWLSLGLVALGLLVMVIALKERSGYQSLLDEQHRQQSVARTLMGGIDILWREPRIAAAAVVRIINTTPYFGFFIFLPGFFTEQIGFTQTEYLSLITIMGLVGMSFNPIVGKLSDRIGWRKVLTVFGGLGSGISMLLMYFVPQWSHGSFVLSVICACLYGITLCGYVPAAALFSSLCQPKDKGNAMAIYCFAAGLSTFFGPALYGAFNALFGTSGVVWGYAALYLISALVSWCFLLSPLDPGEQHNPEAQRLRRLDSVASE